MLRQLAFGIAAMACLSLCTVELNAQCVGCSQSAPVYSTPISSGAVYGAPVQQSYGAQSYGVQSYGVQSYAAPVENHAPAVSYAAPVESYAAPVNYAAPVDSYAAPAYNSYPAATSSCGCSGQAAPISYGNVAPVSYEAAPISHSAPVSYPSSPCVGCGYSTPAPVSSCGCNGGVVSGSYGAPVAGGVITEGVHTGGVIEGGTTFSGVITDGTIIESTPVIESGDGEQAAPPAPTEAPAADGPSPVTETSGKADMLMEK